MYDLVLCLFKIVNHAFLRILLNRRIIQEEEWLKNRQG